MTWKPWTFFLVAVAGWMNRQQQQVIEYLREENRILREKLGHKRIILNESQKRRLAITAMKLGRDTPSSPIDGPTSAPVAHTVSPGPRPQEACGPRLQLVEDDERWFFLFR
jgi:hypothetical protein